MAQNKMSAGCTSIHTSYQHNDTIIIIIIYYTNNYYWVHLLIPIILEFAALYLKFGTRGFSKEDISLEDD